MNGIVIATKAPTGLQASRIRMLPRAAKESALEGSEEIASNNHSIVGSKNLVQSNPAALGQTNEESQESWKLIITKGERSQGKNPMITSDTSVDLQNNANGQVYELPAPQKSGSGSFQINLNIMNTNTQIQEESQLMERGNRLAQAPGGGADDRDVNLNLNIYNSNKQVQSQSNRAGLQKGSFLRSGSRGFSNGAAIISSSSTWREEKAKLLIEKLKTQIGKKMLKAFQQKSRNGRFAVIQFMAILDRKKFQPKVNPLNRAEASNINKENRIQQTKGNLRLFDHGNENEESEQQSSLIGELYSSSNHMPRSEAQSNFCRPLKILLSKVGLCKLINKVSTFQDCSIPSIGEVTSGDHIVDIIGVKDGQWEVEIRPKICIDK